MIPVYQDKFVKREPGETDPKKWRERGNCFSACVASILEIPLRMVPNFSDTGDWEKAFDDWCHMVNIEYECFNPNLGPEYRKSNKPPDGWSIMSGRSPRDADIMHAVVAFDGVMFHDPYPARVGAFPPGIIGDPRDYITLKATTSGFTYASLEPSERRTTQPITNVVDLMEVGLTEQEALHLLKRKAAVDDQE